MHSSELPITEWWDPEWDVYDVPSSPYDVQRPGVKAEALPEALFDAWWEAYDHTAEVAYIMTGSRWGWPDNLHARQLTQHAYPGQPSTRTQPPVKPCACLYLPPEWWLIEGSGVVMLKGSRFVVTPECPHHGPVSNPTGSEGPEQLTIEALWNDPALNVMRDPYDLDDNERQYDDVLSQEGNCGNDIRAYDQLDNPDDEED